MTSSSKTPSHVAQFIMLWTVCKGVLQASLRTITTTLIYILPHLLSAKNRLSIIIAITLNWWILIIIMIFVKPSLRMMTGSPGSSLDLGHLPRGSSVFFFFFTHHISCFHWSETAKTYLKRTQIKEDHFAVCEISHGTLNQMQTFKKYKDIDIMNIVSIHFHQKWPPTSRIPNSHVPHPLSCSAGGLRGLLTAPWHHLLD